MYKNETIQVLGKKLVNSSEPGSEINTLNSTTQNPRGNKGNTDKFNDKKNLCS